MKWASSCQIPGYLQVVIFSLWANEQVKGSSEKLTAGQLGDYYKKLADEFPIVSIEDAFDQVSLFGRHGSTEAIHWITSPRPLAPSC